MPPTGLPPLTVTTIAGVPVGSPGCGPLPGSVVSPGAVVVVAPLFVFLESSLPLAITKPTTATTTTTRSTPRFLRCIDLPPSSRRTSAAGRRTGLGGDDERRGAGSGRPGERPPDRDAPVPRPGAHGDDRPHPRAARRWLGGERERPVGAACE